MKDITRAKTIDHYFDATIIGEIFDLEAKKLCRIFSYENGELICEKDNDLTYLLFLLQGEVKIFTMLENGKVYLLRMEKAVSVYGDLEVLYDRTYATNVEALGSCHCLGLPIAYIRRQCLDSPVFLKYIISSLSERLNRITNMSTSNLLKPLKDKLASYLLAHMNRNETVIHIRVTYVEVAEHLGTTYRHLSRVLSEMEDEGLIRKQGRAIELMDVKTLQSLASDTYPY